MRETKKFLNKGGTTIIRPLLAKRASLRSEQHVFNAFKVGTVMVTLKGEILGMDDNAREIGGRLGWNIK